MGAIKQRTVPVSANGRMNLPADMRRALGLSGAGHLLLTLEGDEVIITTTRQAIQRVRELAAPYKADKAGSDLESEQLIRQRREEAARENDEEEDQS